LNKGNIEKDIEILTMTFSELRKGKELQKYNPENYCKISPKLLLGRVQSSKNKYIITIAAQRKDRLLIKE
jgi:hypothetical protein